MPVRLTQAATKAYREAKLREQGMRCALTGYTISYSEAVLDHDHKTGHVRGVIHRGVNSLLGKLENNMARYGVTMPMLLAMGGGLAQYLNRDFSSNPFYYSHRTDDEKREKRNAMARKKRAEAKKGTA